MSRNDPHGFAAAAAAGGANGYAALAASTEKQRQAALGAAAARQTQVIGGYDSQIAKSAAMGQQVYDKLDADYAPITADALATRERNMARVEQYGNSMRSDLDIKNKQALAEARQSSIMRGLGNTTIQDSLVRGQNFDNTRQVLSLEDQLLQNRISTDSSLSAKYQDTMQSRAQGLATQGNNNISNDNQLAAGKLNYIGGIPTDNTYLDVSNIYAQGLQMQNANEQAALNRAAQQQQQAYSQPSYTTSFTPQPFRAAQPIYQLSARSLDTF